MAEVVFVLGAGASVESGAPMMTNFLDVAEDLWRTNERGGDDESFERVFKGISAFKSVHAQLALDTTNLETVFSAFEMGAMVGRLGSQTDPDEIAKAAPAMARVISRTLTQTVRFPAPKTRVQAPASYETFVSLLRRIRSPVTKIHRPATRGPKGVPAVITLNYDLALDYALFVGGMPPAYWLSEETHAQGSIKLLKLHGSLNWGMCRKCQRVTPWNLSAFFQNRSWQLFYDEPDRTVMLDVFDKLGEFRHDCGEVVGGAPVVVPPTWNKSDNQLLRNVWQHAARELSEARYIVFIGYSFPETDMYFQYLLALGLAGDARIRRIVVVNPDPAPGQKLGRALGVGVRHRLETVNKGFSASIPDVERLLEVDDRTA
ncbi:hypothetical protein ACOQFB_12470 [Anaeromyxobacter sp. Red801]|uniref:hypothetical protein n=1 Tax=Anaeromyxobacter sp. Red801 TaxID=3411632 RepID=UPI003B9F174F